jgi:hypothetical protein
MRFRRLKEGTGVELTQNADDVAVAAGISAAELAALEECLDLAEARRAYSRRKVICEPVFGNFKNKGMRILVRGKAKVAAWWKLAAAAHNVEKIVGYMAAAAAASN